MRVNFPTITKKKENNKYTPSGTFVKNCPTDPFGI